MKGFKPQLFGFTDFGVGMKHQTQPVNRLPNSTFGFFVVVFSQDGGLLINNPTALAIHECQCLWPDTPLECVVSLGTGRFESTGKSNAAYTSLKTKLTNVISSATDTEGKDAPQNDGDLL